MTHFGYIPKNPHKLFVSFYHHDDEPYRAEFERQFGHVYISKSVNLGAISDGLSTNYIKRLIRDKYVSDASVVVVLVGPNTRHRKHVDWEISAGLEPGKGRSGLLGIILPTFPNYGVSYDPELMPPRLQQNVDSGYAGLCWWSQINGNVPALVSLVNGAFESRKNDSLAKNGWPQKRYNTS